jgi:hypothetical protein
MCIEKMSFQEHQKYPMRKSHRLGRKSGNNNLIFDELHCRFLKIQLVTQPHENWSKLKFPHSDISVLCMVPGNQNDSMSQKVGHSKKDRQTIPCTLLGVRDTMKNEVLSV